MIIKTLEKQAKGGKNRKMSSFCVQKNEMMQYSCVNLPKAKYIHRKNHHQYGETLYVASLKKSSNCATFLCYGDNLTVNGG